MQVEVTRDQKALAQLAVESGRLNSEIDAVQEALSLWKERERQRIEFVSSLEEARASIARNEGRVINEESNSWGVPVNRSSVPDTEVLHLESMSLSISSKTSTW